MTKLLTKTTQFALLALSLSFSVSSMANTETTDLEVHFSDHLDKHMDRISALDKKREKTFRKYRQDGSRLALQPRDRLNNGRFFETEWANERLIPDLEEYSVPTLITEMMKRGIDGANPNGFDGRIVLEIDKMYVARFPLAAINSFNTRISGTVKHFDSTGSLVAEHKIRTGLVPNFVATRNYKGPDYAYISTSGTTRVGPIVTEFTTEALEKVFPDYDAPELVFIRSNG